MTTQETQGQDNTADNQVKPTLSLDAAAFAAAAAQPPAAAPAGSDADKGAGATHAADDAIKAIEADTQKASEPAAGEGEPKFRDFASLKPDEIEKILAEPDDVKLAPKQEEKKTDAPEGEGEDAAAKPAAEGEDGKKQPIMIPKARLDDALNKGKETKEQFESATQRTKELEDQLAKEREEKAYYKGLAEGAKSAAPAAGTKPEKTPEERVKEVNADLQRLEQDRENSVLKIAEDFDAGKITMKQAEQEKSKLNRTADALKDRMLSARNEIITAANTPKVEDHAPQVLEDPRLQVATEKLVKDNPWLDYLTPQAFKTLHGLAVQRMEEKGIPNVPTPEATWQLRSLIASVGKEMGMDQLKVPAGSSPANANTKTPASQRPTAEQLKSKLDMAASQPPAPGAGGVSPKTDNLEDVVSNQNLSARDLAKTLPADTLRRMAEGQ